MPRLSLFIPGLRPDGAAAAPAALARLLARADWQPAPQTLPRMLLTQLGLAADAALPIGPLCALHDLALTSVDAGWCRADPVHLRADPRLVLLLAPGRGEVAAEEAAAAVAALNAQLPECEWRVGRSPERWYVRAPDLEHSSPYGPAWLSGRSVTPFISRAPSARRWRGLFNDAQMVLHALPLNELRAARGLTALNALWLWGSDGAPAAGPRPAVAAAIGNDVLLAGAAQTAGVAWTPATGAAELLTRLEREDLLLMLDAPWGAALPDAPLMTLETFAHELLPALWRALGRNGFEAIELFGETACGRLRPGGRWRFWRRATALAPGDCHDLPELP